MAGAHAAVVERSTTARNSITVAGWTLVSRITGVLRVLVIGAVLGPTYFANTFQAGFAVPNLICTVLAGPILAMVVVPALVRSLLAVGIAGAQRVFAGVTGFAVAVSAALALLLVVLSPLIARALTFGISDDSARGRAEDLTVLLLIFVAPQGILYALAALGAAAQQARGRFALAAAAPSVENLGLITTMTLAAACFGTGHEVDEVPVGLVVLLGLGTTASVALHAGLQLFGAARAGLRAWPRRWRDHAESADAVRRLVRSASVAGCPSAAWLVLLALGSTVPGGVFVLQVSYAAHYTVIALSSYAVSTAALPELSDAASEESGPARARFAASWRQALFYTLVPSVPLVVLFLVAAQPGAEILATGEAHSQPLIDQLGGCLAVVAFTQLAGGLHNLGRQALFARLDDAGPRLAGYVALTVSLTVGSIAMLFPAGESRLVCLAVAILAGEAAGAVVVISRLHGVIGAGQLFDPAKVRVVLCGFAVMAPVVMLGWWLSRVGDGGLPVQVPVLAAFAVAGLAGYVAVLRMSPATRAVLS